MFCKKGVLRNLAKFTGKHLTPVNFAKFSYRTPPVAGPEQKRNFVYLQSS